MSPRDLPPFAYRIPQAVEVSGLSRTALYEDIAAGLLIATKRGSRTIILAEHLKAYLAALPTTRRAGGAESLDIEGRAQRHQPLVLKHA